MKKRVGLLTWHYYSNFGSALQAYALQEAIKTYGLQLRPIEMNIIYDIPGEEIYLYDIKENAKAPKNTKFKVFRYEIRGFTSKEILSYAKDLIATTLINKIKK